MSTASIHPTIRAFPSLLSTRHHHLAPASRPGGTERRLGPWPSADVTALVLESLTGADRWRGVSEDDALAPTMRLRSDLGLDFPRAGALSAALREALPYTYAPQVTECVSLALDTDASLQWLASRLALLSS